LFELLKLMVQAVILERDADGKIIGEQVTEAVVFYSQAQIEEFFTALYAQIEEKNEQELLAHDKRST
jgi:hypothetical protein